jgi:hypothetical protein
MEIIKLKEELMNAQSEKAALEEEIKTRSQELYAANEKLIFFEFN